MSKIQHNRGECQDANAQLVGFCDLYRIC